MDFSRYLTRAKQLEHNIPKLHDDVSIVTFVVKALLTGFSVYYVFSCVYSRYFHPHVFTWLRILQYSSADIPEQKCLKLPPSSKAECSCVLVINSKFVQGYQTLVDCRCLDGRSSHAGVRGSPRPREMRSRPRRYSTYLARSTTPDHHP
jgi:hypothetical protein